MSLYSQVGGEAGIALVVEDFYSRVVADDLLGAWFSATDGESLRRHLRAYLAVALGGPEAYSGRSMRAAHAGLDITGTAFDAVLDRLADSLVAAGVDAALTVRVLRVIATLRPVVVRVPGV
jgi:hemoglobin